MLPENQCTNDDRYETNIVLGATPEACPVSVSSFYKDVGDKLRGIKQDKNHG
jgi:hypothetical protein